MAGLLAFIFCILVLYLLSQKFINNFFIFLLRIFGSREKASLVLGLVFLPGTFVHEISHFLMAMLLLVPVGRINLKPEVLDRGVKLGSVEIAKTDFIRGSLIGLAPVFAGLGILFWITSYVLANGSFEKWWLVAILIYVIFQLTHSMFSSRTDLRAVLELVVFIAIIVVFLVIFEQFGPINFVLNLLREASPFLERLSLFLLLPIGVEILFLGVFRKFK